jgi:lysocardiolipin and lysophospholipid acyltransferase
LFPEGTNLSAQTKAKSNAFAAKQTIYNQPYEYCLHPRVTGFTYLLNLMRSSDLIDTVDDVTIGYEGKFPVTELDLLKGHIPKVVHFHVKRYNINEIPQEDEQIDQWLLKCWDEKENRLKE